MCLAMDFDRPLTPLYTYLYFLLIMVPRKGTFLFIGVLTAVLLRSRSLPSSPSLGSLGSLGSSLLQPVKNPRHRVPHLDSAFIGVSAWPGNDCRIGADHQAVEQCR